MNFIPKKADNILANGLNREDYSLYKIHNEKINIKRIIQNDFIDEIDKYNLINRYFYIKYDINDVLDIINLLNNSNYDSFKCISTKMEKELYDCKGHGTNFKWWQTYNKVCFLCAVESNKYIENKSYTYDELMRLINNNVIFPINSYFEQIDKFSEDREKFKYIKTLKSYGIDVGDIYFDFDYNNKVVIEDDYYDIIANDNKIPLILELIEQKLDKNFVAKNAKYYINSLSSYIRKEGNEKEKEQLVELQDFYHNYFDSKRKLRRVKR